MKDLTSLQFALLGTLAEKPAHGYALVDAMGEALARRPGVATVYTALQKLADAGLIKHDRDEAVDGRLRRYFSITASGTEVLTIEAEEMARRAHLTLQKLRRRQMLEVSA